MLKAMRDIAEDSDRSPINIAMGGEGGATRALAVFIAFGAYSFRQVFFLAGGSLGHHQEPYIHYPMHGPSDTDGSNGYELRSCRSRASMPCLNLR